ncbi:sugar phosphate isomerase/epimerase family protein [Alkalibacterium sp.]|nr:MAG: sugar phosphate isomerase/epimerase [Alkalibacterium sp.]
MIGVCSVTFKDKSIEEVIQLAKKAGLDCIEWGSKEHVQVGDLEVATHTARLTEEAGLKTSSYGSYYQAGSFDSFEDVIETARHLNTQMIRIWAGEKASEEADDVWFQKVLSDTRRIAEMAEKEDMTISFEYHSGSLTDTPESARWLMESINVPNVYLYWQPAETLSVAERLGSLDYLSRWISNIHVFHWEDYNNRFSLAEGEKEWLQYLPKIQQGSERSHHYLLEFVKNDNPEQFFQDAETLKEWVKNKK